METTAGAAAADATAVRLELTEEGKLGGAPQKQKSSKQQQRQPKRLVYFSDGVLEEYSTDESSGAEDEDRPMRRTVSSTSSSSSRAKFVQQRAAVDPRQLTWLPWMWHCGCRMGRGLLKTADFCGERVAWFFGITTPKYGYIIREYNRIKEEEEKEKLERVAELEARRKYEAELQQQPQPPSAAQVPMANLSG